MTAAQQVQTAQKNPEYILHHILERMDRLIILHTQELDFLSANDMKKFQEIQPEKIRLVRDCESGIEEIAKNTDGFNACDPALKKRLLNSHGTLRDLADKSKRACQSRSKSVQRIQERLLQAARLAVGKTEKKNYGRTGKTETPRQRPIATAINEAI